MKYLKLLKYELTSIKRNPLLIILIAAPILQILMFGIIIPTLIKELSETEKDMTFNILILFGISLGSIYSGMILGFSLVESKDDKSINTISVTPMGIQGFVIFKIVFVTLISVATTSIFVYSIRNFNIYSFGSITNLELFLIVIIISLSAPFYGLVTATLAKDKVQAMVIAKSFLGIVTLAPLITLWDTFSDYKQYLLGLFPNFWAIQAMRVKLPYNKVNKYDLSFELYLLLGLAVSIVVICWCIKEFVKKSGK